ncbi:MAG: nucleotidyltransferase domain-containing protein [Euryarchaeota archaeon]|nr:nucleotidyltransferase domain-containing protein [Euryarchaeota archaeon]
MDKTIIKKIKNDFKPFHNRVLGIVLYGSQQKGTQNSRSDIDICMIAPDEKPQVLFKQTLPLNYDIKIFETMPLFLKIQVIQNHKILYAKDQYELFEYFYEFRKLWDDQKYRQHVTRKEALHLFS